MKKIILPFSFVFCIAICKVNCQGIIKTLIGGYYGNSKVATPILSNAEIASGVPVDYTIRFANTGYDTVRNLLIIDTLSTFLQSNTIQFDFSSHNCILTIDDNFIRLEFRDINLIDSHQSKGSSVGFVNFKVMANYGLPGGTQITNKASIYFDNKQPVVTNTAITIINPIVTPVKLLNYNVSVKSERNILNSWKTSLEINAHHFNVQRSIDGKDFLNVGRLEAVGVSNYNFIDVLPNGLIKELFYRLEMVDYNGTKTYSEIRQLKLNKLQKNCVNVYPNPASTEIKISRQNEINAGEEISILDAMGKTVLKKVLIKTNHIVDICSLTKGVYLVVFENGDRVKFVKD